MFGLGKRLKGEFARIIAHPGTGLVGIAVAKKIGSKPRRNHVKRRFRAVLSGAHGLLDSRLDYVLVVNAEGATATFSGIDAEVRSLLIKVRDRWESELESS